MLLIRQPCVMTGTGGPGVEINKQIYLGNKYGSMAHKNLRHKGLKKGERKTTRHAR